MKRKQGKHLFPKQHKVKPVEAPETETRQSFLREKSIFFYFAKVTFVLALSGTCYSFW